MMLRNAFSLMKGIANYYASWPMLLAILGVGLNSLALVDVHNPWVLAVLGNSSLLFLIGHSASKATLAIQASHDLADEIKEIRLVSKNSSRQIANLRRQNKRVPKSKQLYQESAHLNRRTTKQDTFINNKNTEAIQVNSETSSKSIEDALRQSLLARGEVEHILKDLKCLEAKYSLYLASHPSRHSLDRISNDDLYRVRSFTKQQVNNLVCTYQKCGEISKKTIKAFRSSSDFILINGGSQIDSQEFYKWLDEEDKSAPIVLVSDLSKKRFYKDFYSRLIGGEKYPLRHEHLKSLLLFEELNKNLAAKRWKFIILISDPIAQNINDFYNNYQCKYKLSEKGIDELTSLFLQEHSHSLPLVNFELLAESIVNTFGVNIFDQVFDTSKGIGLYTKGNAHILLLRIEGTSKSYEVALQEVLGNFLSASLFSQLSQWIQNISDYNSLESKLQLPESYVKNMYSSRYVTHFYSKNKIEAMTEKWVNTKPSD